MLDRLDRAGVFSCGIPALQPNGILVHLERCHPIRASGSTMEASAIIPDSPHFRRSRSLAGWRSPRFSRCRVYDSCVACFRTACGARRRRAGLAIDSGGRGQSGRPAGRAVEASRRSAGGRSWRARRWWQVLLLIPKTGESRSGPGRSRRSISLRARTSLRSVSKSAALFRF